MPDFDLRFGGRVVTSKTSVDIYYQSPVPVRNITRVDNPFQALTSSGSIILSSYPLGVNIFNGNLGAVIDYEFSTSGINRFKQEIETNLHRVGVAISGAIIAGRS